MSDPVIGVNVANTARPWNDHQRIDNFCIVVKPADMPKEYWLDLSSVVSQGDTLESVQVWTDNGIVMIEHVEFTDEIVKLRVDGGEDGKSDFVNVRFITSEGFDGVRRFRIDTVGVASLISVDPVSVTVGGTTSN